MSKDKTEHYERVENFHRLAGQPRPVHIIIPEEERRILRAKLILEEAIETIEALGIDIWIEPYYDEPMDVEMKNIVFEPSTTRKPDIEEIIDGCCDIIYVTTGTLIEMGVPDKPFQEEIDENNLSKFDDGWYKREDGKIMKSPNWKPPKIKELLEEYGWNDEEN